MLDRFKRPRREWKPDCVYREVRVAGVTHQNTDGSHRQAYLQRCKPGMTVSFRREPRNRFDRNAIAIFVQDRRQIGYVPAESAGEMARLMDSGEAAFAGELMGVNDFEADDGRDLIAATVVITRLKLATVYRLSFAAMGGAAVAGTAKAGLRAVRLVTSVAGRLAAVIDRRLLTFAQGSRFFCNVYWSLILLCMTIATAGIVALR